MNLGKQYGLNKESQLKSININAVNNIIYVEYYINYIDEEGKIFKQEDYFYQVTGDEFTNWDNQLGLPYIRPAIDAKILVAHPITE